MSARRFRHRDRQQARPGSPQQAPGEAPPGIRIRVSGILCPHTPPPGSSDMGHTPGIRHSGFPVAYASGISDTAHHGHRMPDIRRTPDTGVRHTGLPAAYASEIKYPVFPTSGAAGRLASGMKKSGMKKGNPVSDSPSDAPCCARIPGGGAISSRAGRSTRASTYRP